MEQREGRNKSENIAIVHVSANPTVAILKSHPLHVMNDNHTLTTDSGIWWVTKLMPPAFDSSVGRAWDCNGYILSRGRWFEPGSKDSFFVATPGEVLVVVIIMIAISH
jgi:hypothetical protein